MKINATYSRPLGSDLLVAMFVMGVLGLKKEEEIGEAIKQIADAEMLLAQVGEQSTLRSADYRHYRYRDEDARQTLRKAIVKELVGKKRLLRDDGIKLGRGGVLPRTALKDERVAFILIGLPASGKSTVASRVADEYGAVILDSDYAKRKFPEFTRRFGASVVHDESALVTFGDAEDYPDELSVMEYCLLRGYNIVMPRIGNNKDKLVELAEKLQRQRYQVHLTLVSLDRQKATLRAYKRYLDSERYVPLPVIFDLFANEPILSYYRLKEENNPAFATYGKISTDVAPGEAFKFVAGPLGNPATLFQ